MTIQDHLKRPQCAADSEHVVTDSLQPRVITVRPAVEGQLQPTQGAAVEASTASTAGPVSFLLEDPFLVPSTPKISAQTTIVRYGLHIK